MARWHLVLVGRLPLPNEIYAMSLRQRMHTKRAWRENTRAAVIEAGVPRLRFAEVTFTRYSAGRPDADALPAAFKPVADGLTDMRWVGYSVLPDDSPEHLKAAYVALPCPRGAAHITIAIDGVEAEGAA